MTDSEMNQRAREYAGTFVRHNWTDEQVAAFARSEVEAAVQAERMRIDAAIESLSSYGLLPGKDFDYMISRNAALAVIHERGRKP